jgi:hypothetical protein
MPLISISICLQKEEHHRHCHLLTDFRDKNDLFIEEGAQIEFSTLNTKTGKIYIGKNAEVMEGCHLRGPIVLGDDSKFNLDLKFTEQLRLVRIVK